MSRKARLPGNTASPLNYRILLFRGGHGGQNGSGERVTHHVAELRKSFQQAQLSHTTVVQRLRQQLQDALESHTASQGQLEGQLAAEKQARSAVSRDLVAAQREMEALVQHNLELASAAMGGQAYQAQVEQEELRASLEAQLAELTSVTDVRGAEEASLERMRRDAKQHTAGMAAVEAQMERMGRDASDAAHLQEQVQQLQARERLQGEVTGANKQVQAELAAQAAGRQQAITAAEHRARSGGGGPHNPCHQEEGWQLLQRAEIAEGQVHHLQDHNFSLSARLADFQQQLPALQSQLQDAAEGKQSATATERLGGQAADLAELAATRLKLQDSQVACKALEKDHARAERFNQELQAAVAAQQLAEDNLVDTNKKLAASDKKLKAVTKKTEASSSRKGELQQQKFDLVQRVQGLDEQLGIAHIQLEEEIGQNCYLANQVEVLRAQLVSAGLEPASVEQADDGYGTLLLSDLDTTVSHGGQEDEEVTTPQSMGSTFGSPYIGAGWGHLTAGASCSNDVAQRLQMHDGDASGMDNAASGRWLGKDTEKVQKGKGDWDGLKQGYRGNARHSDNREKSRLGELACNFDTRACLAQSSWQHLE
ncbi:hypothetical protein WJX77_004256 [Trebouxia sp. C0004]